MKTSKTSPMRLGLYRKIEIAHKQLPGLDDDGVWRERLRSSFGVDSRKDLNMHQLATLVQDLARDGARFTAGKKSRNPGVRSLSREDWVEVPANSPFAAEKRMIAALWRKLGYSMNSLDTRCKRAFGCARFVWMADGAQISRLIVDLQKRVKAAGLE